MGTETSLSGPDLAIGVSHGDLLEATPLVGHAGGEAIVLVRERGSVHAIGATCTHYGGPLGEGLVVDGTIRCPWHHACFDLATGAARGPAIANVACFDVVAENGTIRVGAKRLPVVPDAPTQAPPSVLIVGGGAAGVACAEALRSEGFRGTITLATDEGSDPVDRPNLSKDYLAGSAPEEWVTLRSRDALAEIGVEIVPERVASFDASAHSATLENGRELGFGALVLATGAEPIRLPIDGASSPHVHVLRTFADSKAIASAALAGSRAVVIGASFIGLEAAASLRARGLDVTVVAPELIPLARVLGDEVGSFVRRIHESNGISFRLGRKPVRVDTDTVTLDDGETLPATLVVMGVGVRPRLALAEAASLKVDRGVVVDADLRTSLRDVFAAGDIARYPWAGASVRIEHFQVAIRHGQRVARAIVGRGGSRAETPFFWTQHHDVTIGYVGHAERFDRVVIRGDLEARDATIGYFDGALVVAVATINRDRVGLYADAAFERGDQAALVALLE